MLAPYERLKDAWLHEMTPWLVMLRLSAPASLPTMPARKTPLGSTVSSPVPPIVPPTQAEPPPSAIVPAPPSVPPFITRPPLNCAGPLKVSEPPDIVICSALCRLASATTADCTLTTTDVGTSIVTLSPFCGTMPPLQFAASSQLPLVLLTHVR